MNAANCLGIENDMIPYEFGIRYIFPNPFNPIVNIEYEISESGRVTISIYDLNGRIVNTLLDDYKYPGSYSAAWAGLDQNNHSVATGIYLAVLQSDRQLLQTKKIILLK